MSEKAPGQYPLTPDEEAVLVEKRKTQILEASKKLDEVALPMGYISVATLGELNLTPEQIDEFNYQSLSEAGPSQRYYIAERKDGEKAKVVVQPKPNGEYLAELFSPLGHGSNHDFSLGEMKGSMDTHLNRGKDGNPI